MNTFLKDTGIAIDFDLPQSVWLQARRRLARYAQRCRVTVAGRPKRLLADFVIGSHALTQADRFSLIRSAINGIFRNLLSFSGWRGTASHKLAAMRFGPQ